MEAKPASTGKAGPEPAWNSSDNELTDEERKRHLRFKALRDNQEREANRRLTWLDVVVFATAFALVRAIFNKLQLSLLRTARNACIVAFGIALFRGRAPKKILPFVYGDYPLYPILGQIGQSE